MADKDKNKKSKTTTPETKGLKADGEKHEVKTATKTTKSTTKKSKPEKLKKPKTVYRPRRPERKLPVASLADATGTSKAVFDAMQIDFGWKSTAKITRSEFMRKRSEWLNSEVK